jgi:cyclophilin family peptidyl-prolyl cis-trans isomerase
MIHPKQTLLRESRCHSTHAFTTVQPRKLSVACRASKQQGSAEEPSLLQRCAIGFLAAATAAMPLTVAPILPTPPAHALLTAGDPIKNASAILRYALPIDNKPIRKVQRDLELIAEALRIPGSKSLGPVAKAVRSSQSVLTKERNAIINDFAPDKKEAGLAGLERLDQGLIEFQALIDAKDKQAVPIKQREVLEYVGQVEAAMVKGFPFEVPKEYADRPLLKGRATLEMKVEASETPEGPQDVILTIVLDGYNAPVSAGQFIDLVQKKFYDGMTIQRADGFVVQTGDPDGKEEGYVDPATGQVRRVPMEIRVTGEKEPIYDFNLEELGRFNEQPVLPFNAYGTLAWARAEFDNNSASSQVFFLLKESELTPSGANLLDGRYAVFGYVTSGQDNLGIFKVGDKIDYIKVVSGGENLVNA